MYKLTEHLKKVRAFATNDNGELVLTKDNSFYIQDGNKYIKYYDFPEGMDEIYYKEYFFTSCMWGDKFFLYDGEIVKNDELAGFLTKEIMTITRLINGKQYFLTYNLKTKEEIPYKNPINTFAEFTVGAVYQRKFPSNTVLEKVSLVDNQIVWQTNLKTLGKYFKKEYEIENVIGVHNGELLVGCSNTVLLAINPNTGAIIHQWQTIEKTADGTILDSKISNFTSVALLPNENKLMGVGDSSVWEIDLVSRLATRHYLSEELAQYDIDCLTGKKCIALNDTHLILTAYTNEDLNVFKVFGVILALNIKTLKIDWMHNFKESKKGNFRKTEVAGDKLYQIDDKGNLFIFEKI